MLIFGVCLFLDVYLFLGVCLFLGKYSMLNETFFMICGDLTSKTCHHAEYQPPHIHVYDRINIDHPLITV